MFGEMKCWECEGEIYVRECDLEVALISGKAHMDCLNGHSYYAWVSRKDIAESKEYYKLQKVNNEQKKPLLG